MVQEFNHTLQQSSELVSEFILWLEQTFTHAYGREKMSAEIRDTLFYARRTKVKSPAILGTRSYSEMCLAAWNEV